MASSEGGEAPQRREAQRDSSAKLGGSFCRCRVQFLANLGSSSGRLIPFARNQPNPIGQEKTEKAARGGLRLYCGPVLQLCVRGFESYRYRNPSESPKEEQSKNWQALVGTSLPSDLLVLCRVLARTEQRLQSGFKYGFRQRPVLVRVRHIQLESPS
jgi:hypothetical protein